MKRSVATAAALLLLAGPAGAVFDADDPVPAATLLLPYFEVDRVDPNGVKTTFTVRNASPAPALAHITLWSVGGDPMFVFDLYLTGFDAQEVRLVDVIEDGPPFNPFCDLVAAEAAPATRGVIPRGFDPIVTGFATIDSVSECSSATPDDKGYFVGGGFGIANNANVLWGDYQLVDRAEGVAFGERLVAIEALEPGPFLVPRGGTPVPTFYSTLAGSGGADDRERLSARWGGRYDVRRGARTDVILWRNFPPVVCLLPCAAPRGLPTQTVGIFAFDEDENVADLTELDPFRSIASRVTLDSEDLPIQFDTGWLFVDASATGGAAATGEPAPRGIPLEGQAHMVVLRWLPNSSSATAMRGINLRSAGFSGTE